MLNPIRSDQPEANNYAALYELLVRELRGAAVFLLDPDGRLSSWHPGVEKLLGFPESEWLGQHGAIIFTEEDRARGEHLKELQTAAETGCASDVRWHLRKDGSRIFVDGVMQALRRDDGVLLGFSKVLKDATDRQIAQERLHSTLESITDAFYAVDSNFRFTYVSRRAEELWGRNRTELIGRHIWTEFPTVVGSHSYNMHQKVMSERTAVRYETVSPIIGRWIDVSIYPDALGGISCYFRDIEARRQQETRVQQLSEALSQAQVIVRSLDGVIRFWTAGCERLYGFPESEALGKNVFDLLRVELPASIEHINRELIAAGEWHGELIQHRRDGTMLTCASDWIIHRPPDGSDLAVIESNIDITEQKHIEDELNRLNGEWRQFSHFVSHDLQAPVRMVRSYAELLSRRYASKLDEQANDFLTFIVQGGSTMEAMIRTLLRYAQLTEQHVEKQAVPVEETLAAVLMVLEPEIEESKAKVTYNNLPTVQADPVQIQRVFQNLIGNAIKYRKPDVPPEIRVEAEASGRYWLFSVHDNGMGIAEGSCERIFQPLQRLHGAEIAGTGIGLAVCKRIVERHGGRIWVDSAPGIGSTFRFTLPVR